MRKAEEIIHDLKAIKEYFQEESGGCSPVCLDDSIAFIEANKRPEGKWKQTYKVWLNERGEEVPYYRIVCSNCSQTNNWGNVPYCPWCGAKMEAAEDIEFGGF